MNDTKIKTERIDDVPLLIAHQKKMGIPNLIDRHFKAHGNRKGLSLGWLATVWLSHIISESDHRMNVVRDWSKQLEETLKKSTGQEIEELDFTDDRLEDLLRYLNQTENWESFERSLNRNVIRVYDLKKEVVRIDSTTSLSYCGITEEGLFQYGYSKDKRPDLAQLKVNLATLDPLGIPLATTVLKGNEADDGLYIPAIEQVRRSLPEEGKLYIGDSKMGAIKTRSFIESKGEYYLCPLSLVQLPPEDLNVYIDEAGLRELSDVERTMSDGTREVIAKGYRRAKIRTDKVDGREITWIEQLFVVRSFKLAEAGERGLNKRLNAAIEELDNLLDRRQGKKLISNRDQLQKAIDDILERYDVRALLHVNCTETSITRTIRRYRDRPERQVIQAHFQLDINVNQLALNRAINRLGWRVYATNAPSSELDLEKAVLAYRSEFIIEQGFRRLKDKPLSLTPLYLQREDYATGLVRLLSIGLRILTLLQFLARRSLDNAGQTLSDLYPGNPKRSTRRPTAEKLLQAFCNINLTILHENSSVRKFLSELSDLQLHILSLFGFTPDVYSILLE